MIVRATAADALVHVPRGDGAARRRGIAGRATCRSSALSAGRGDGHPAHSAPRGGTGAVATRRERAELAATAAQPIRTSTVVHGMKPSVISETR